MSRMSAGQPRLEVLLACFQGRKRAARVRRPLSEQIKAAGAEILDEFMLTVTPKGKARVYDPRRAMAGTLTPALTWGCSRCWQVEPGDLGGERRPVRLLH